MKKRIIEVAAIDFVKGMWFDTGDPIKNMEHFMGTQHAYMDRTTEKVVKIEPMFDRDAFKVILSTYD